MELSKSPNAGSFIRDMYRKKVKEGALTEAAAEEILTMYDNIDSRKSTPEWKENNLEYDLLTTQWILDKVRNSDIYAQNLYAALCNVDWQRIDIWPILKGESWGCSWRSAGGIIADMQEKGDYIDWYCSGIRSDDIPDLSVYTEEQKIRYAESLKFVGEGTVTDEINNDLNKLGWRIFFTETNT